MKLTYKEAVGTWFQVFSTLDKYLELVPDLAM